MDAGSGPVCLTRPHISHKMSESLGESLSQLSASHFSQNVRIPWRGTKKHLAARKAKPRVFCIHNFRNLNINKALKSTHQITVIIPLGTIFISRKRYCYRSPWSSCALRKSLLTLPKMAEDAVMVCQRNGQQPLSERVSLLEITRNVFQAHPIPSSSTTARCQWLANAAWYPSGLWDAVLSYFASWLGGRVPSVAGNTKEKWCVDCREMRIMSFKLL